MTRQVCYVFFGQYRGKKKDPSVDAHSDASAETHQGSAQPHESPAVMTYPLVVLAVFAVLLSLVGTPIWPWFHDYLSGLGNSGFRSVEAGVLGVLLFSSVVALGGIAVGWWLYGKRPVQRAEAPDVLESAQPDLFTVLRNKFYVDELYEMSVIAWNRRWARIADWLDRVVVDGLVQAVSLLVLAVSWVNRLIDEFVVNLGFDKGCDSLRSSGRWLSLFQNGQVQRYLRVIGLAMFLFGLVFIWGCGV
jgi:NADH-quinone oxidoreductase subunit L